VTYVLASIILTPITVVVFARWFKRHIDRNYPSADRELETVLADGLERVLAKEVA
jgi:hypothetical protein